MSDKANKPNGIGRRGFFGALAGASVGAVAAGSARPAFAEEVGDERTKVRYQETEHVLAFYRTNRYYKKD
ncbi:hypothetical protein [Aestuariivita sp.]|uniref:hypothetical protein n=1 Tax=Aestuariivita sp. TaxID=1872407 RepID=UPI00216ECAF9|nr:hypothetical protein [Aestuariivita sp.]MCE8008462.1 hypothetical protein [Aestuariivita sp.]